ncbi:MULTISPECIES: hypothetical protein [unclassified Luteibacter]|uniref:hypothetical protein n=1 Tax=unclassified Luteibacter TaxID=2620188 RepID=UPI0008CCD424|nr:MULTISPECIES: hypothetical protein [unclassified Luteibacter]MDR6937821.1 hypothetical protein [Luteibacter sp. 3190]SEO41746.1 hypothetical protein SAMN02800692_0688 [Luteibacter sp. UNC138MFCol5.1]
MFRKTLAAVLFVIPAAAFAQTAPTAPRYVDAIDWPASEAGMDRFFNAEVKLGAGFDKICGDTFCEGEYPNVRPMQLRCSVDTTKGTMKQCLWLFSGSTASVNAKSGAVQTTAKLFKCKLLLAKDTPVESFYQVMEGDDPLNAKLPMTNRSVYDGLMGCL